MLAAISSFFTKTEALSSFFQTLDIADTSNICPTGLMTTIVSEFADFTGVQESQIEAIKAELVDSLPVDDEEDDEPAFSVQDKTGAFVLVHEVYKAEEDTRKWGPFVEEDEVIATIRRRDAYNSMYMMGVTLVAKDCVELAQKIWNLLEDGKVCPLCDQYNLLEGTFCRKCALRRLPAPCVGCGLVIGRSIGGSQPGGPVEHSACKRRRIAAAQTQ